MQELINYLSDPNVLALIGGGIGVSAATQAIKHWVGLQNAKVIVFLTGTISVLLVAVTYLMYFAGTNPTALGPDTAIIFATATFAYRFLIQPFYNILIDAQNFRNNQTATNIAAVANGAIDNVDTIAPVIVKTTTVTNSEPKNAPVPSTDEFAG